MDVKVSVVMPLYNSASYMRTSVNSVLNQTLKEIELILVDDASPDDSYKIAREYAESYPNIIRVIHHKQNGRAGCARNDGIKESRGEYIWFIDADDWVDENALEIAYSKAKQGNYDVVSVDYYEVNDESCSYKKYCIGLPDECTGDMTIEKRNLYIIKGTAGFSKLVKREHIMYNALFYPEKIMFEDNGIVPLFGATANTIATIHQGLYFYRIGNPDSQTQKKKTEKMMADRIAALDYLVDKARAISQFDELKIGIEYFYINVTYSSIIKYFLNGSFPLSKDFYYKIKNKAHMQFPEFKKNIALKKYSSKINRISLFLGELGYPFVVGTERLLCPIRITRQRN